MRTDRLLAVATVLAALSGCSGGGGGGGGGGGLALAEINAGNAMTVAGTTVSALLASGELEALQGIAGALANPAAAPVQAPGAPPTAEVTVPINSGDGLCISGNAQGSVTVRDPNVVVNQDRLLPGDSMNLNMNACQIEPGYFYTGGLGFITERLIGTLSDPIEYIFDFKLRKLTGNTPEGDALMHGDMSLFYSQANFPMIDLGLSGRRLSVTVEGETTTLSRYNIATEVILAPPATVLSNIASYDGYLSSADIEGDVQFVTLTPFSYDPGTGWPTQGSMELLGAESAVLRLTIAPGGPSSAILGPAVQLDLDADGDGFYEYTDTVFWGELADEPAI